MMKEGSPTLNAKLTMKKDFKQFFLQDVGSSKITESKFEAFEISSQNQFSDSDDDFKLQEDQQTTDTNGIRTKQFWNGLVGSSEITKNQNTNFQYNLKCVECFGFNSRGRDNIILIDDKVCKAVGCLLIHGQNIYAEHCYRISTLFYQKINGQLLSGSEGPRPEVILWRYKNNRLEVIKKFSLGVKSQPIYSLSFYKKDYILVIEKFSLHKNSTLQLFHKKQGKKTSVKIGKCYDLQVLESQNYSENRIFIGNDKGIAEILENKTAQNSIELNYIHQSNQLTCIYPFSCDQNDSGIDFDIIFGKKTGQLSFLNRSITKKIHQGWIFQIKQSNQQKQRLFFTIGALDLQIAILKLEQTKLNTIKTFCLNEYARSLFIEGQKLLIGSRDGNISLYNIPKLLKSQDITKSLTLQNKSFGSFISSKQTIKEFFVYNKNVERFIYGSNGSKSVQLYNPNQKNKDSFETYTLREYPQTFTTNNQNLIAYTYDIFEIQQQNNKTQAMQSTIKKTNSKMLGFKSNNFVKSVLVIENIKTKKLIKKISLNKQDQVTKKCTALQFHQNGTMIMLGFEDGQIGLFEVESQSNQIMNIVQKKHKQSIIQLIWSKDGTKLKSCSESEIFYWQILQEQQKNLKAKDIKQVKWNKIGRFSGQNKIIWEKMGLVSEVNQIWSHQVIVTSKPNKKEIVSEKRKIIGVNLSEGILKLYIAPISNKSKCKQMKIYDSKFSITPDYSNTNLLRFWVIFQGVALLISLT